MAAMGGLIHHVTNRISGDLVLHDEAYPVQPVLLGLDFLPLSARVVLHAEAAIRSENAFGSMAPMVPDRARLLRA